MTVATRQARTARKTRWVAVDLRGADAGMLRARAVEGAAPVRLAAVKELGRAGDASCADVLLRALADRRADVGRAAAKALAARFVVPRERLWALFLKDTRVAVRARVVRLLARGERVESVVSLLWACALAGGEGQVVDAAARGLRAWGDAWPGDVPLPRVFEVAAALCAAERWLPEDVAGELWAYVTARTGWTRPARTGATAPTPTPAARVPRAVRTAPAPAWPGRVVLRRYELRPAPFARVRAWWRG